MAPTVHKIMWGVDVAPAMLASKFGECNFLIWQVIVAPVRVVMWWLCHPTKLLIYYSSATCASLRRVWGVNRLHESPPLVAQQLAAQQLAAYQWGAVTCHSVLLLLLLLPLQLRLPLLLFTLLAILQQLLGVLQTRPTCTAQPSLARPSPTHTSPLL